MWCSSCPEWRPAWSTGSRPKDLSGGSKWSGPPDVLLDALSTAHRQGVVHRDIKPANILFDDAGAPALADFGIAVTRQFTPGLTATGLVMGTPGFLAPEQARGEPATPASDVFALGATLLFALTGKGPFGEGDPGTLMARTARGHVAPLPKTIPSALRTPLERMLDPRPGRRPTAAAALGGPSGTRVQPAVRTRRSWKRPAQWIGTTLLAVVAGVAGFTAIRISREPTAKAAAASPGRHGHDRAGVHPAALSALWPAGCGQYRRLVLPPRLRRLQPGGR